MSTYFFFWKNGDVTESTGFGVVDAFQREYSPEQLDNLRAWEAE